PCRPPGTPPPAADTRSCSRHASPSHASHTLSLHNSGVEHRESRTDTPRPAVSCPYVMQLESATCVLCGHHLRPRCVARQRNTPPKQALGGARNEQSVVDHAEDEPR